MILSIGIDIVEVYRIAETLARTPRFTERVFTETERAYCDAKGAAAAQSYAGRFAAKEAFLKALKTVGEERSPGMMSRSYPTATVSLRFESRVKHKLCSRSSGHCVRTFPFRTPLSTRSLKSFLRISPLGSLEIPFGQIVLA
jgi:phosphopantetheine--protein transferase-like protein